MQHIKTFTSIATAVILSVTALQAQDNVIANPLDLGYRFATDRYWPGHSHREAADPVVVIFKDKYYLFASKSGGYWSSDDLVHWNYIADTAMKGWHMEYYAPTVLVYKDALYYMATPRTWEGEHFRIYRTTDPDNDKWEEIECKLGFGDGDPMFFLDDDGQVYLYAACSNTSPIFGFRVDPEDGFKILEGPVECIGHNEDKYGWEARGENNEQRAAGYNEGATMNKRNGRYYLQYASDATQFRSYADGVYTSDSPLGPFTYEHNSPFCIKQGGFAAGTGHGTVFQDKYGNWWRVGTIKLSVNAKNERRLGLFPVFFDEQGRIYSPTDYSDYPFAVPQGPCDFSRQLPWLGTVCLSYGGKVSASSVLSEKYDAVNAADECLETWWAASSGKAGEWFQNDLGKRYKVKYLQANFADAACELQGPAKLIYQYRIEGSRNGKRWFTLVDMTQNTEDRPHAFFTLAKGAKVRYVRITNAADIPGNFSLMDLRVFGKAKGKAPAAVGEVKARREDSERRDIFLNWEPVADADGYIVRWGVDPEHLETARMVTEPSLDSKGFNTEDEYYFTVEAFGKGGTGPETEIFKVE